MLFLAYLIISSEEKNTPKAFFPKGEIFIFSETQLLPYNVTVPNNLTAPL